MICDGDAAEEPRCLLERSDDRPALVESLGKWLASEIAMLRPLSRAGTHLETSVDGFVRAITKSNVDKLIADYLALVATVGVSVAGVSGVRLLKSIKRDQVKVGPYPHVTLFEAANRIMTDLVILYGVKWVLSTDAFPFETYNVEYGNEDSHGFDLRASGNGRELVGEAFNVAPSFFQLKKTSMLKKLRAPDIAADFKVLMFNEDAVPEGYKPAPRRSEFFVFVKVDDEGSYMVPSA